MSKKKDITALTLSVPNTDKSIVWIEIGGKKYLIVEMLYDLFDIDHGYANRMITKRYDIFKDMLFDFKKDDLYDLDAGIHEYLTCGRGKSKSVTCLSIAGVLQWMTLLDYKRYSGDRKAYLIQLKIWMVSIAENVLLNQPVVDERQSIEWKEQRGLCKQSNKFLNLSLKENVLDHHSEKNARWVFINEAIMVNKLAFGRHERGIRDTAVPTENLMKLYVAEIADATLCHQKVLNMSDRKDVLESMIDSYLPETIQEQKLKLRGGQRSIEEFT